MPHILFEYSDNILPTDLKKILHEVHLILAKQLPTDLRNCKSKLVRHQEYLVGNREQGNAFVNLVIEILPGRRGELLEAIAKNIMTILQAGLKESLIKLDLQLSVSIKDLPEIHYKTSETLE